MNWKWPKIGWAEAYALIGWVCICLLLLIPIDYFVSNDLLKFMIYCGWCFGAAGYVIPKLEEKMK